MKDNLAVAAQRGLKLKEPWYVERNEIDDEDHAHIYLEIRKDATFRCPHCGG